MKLKMTMVQGEDICEMLKKSFDCSSDQELLIIMKAMLKANMSKEVIDPEDFDITCELVD